MLSRQQRILVFDFFYLVKSDLPVRIHRIFCRLMKSLKFNDSIWWRTKAIFLTTEKYADLRWNVCIQNKLKDQAVVSSEVSGKFKGNQFSMSKHF